MIYFAAFTARGAALAAQLASSVGTAAKAFAFEKYAQAAGCLPIHGLQSWCGQAWSEADSLVFVGAAGIAVRGIAPYVKSKLTDPGVVVMDEAGRYIISLLSGHIGGGNDLALRLAVLTGGTPVVTTATDVNRLFAVDVFAKDNDLYITSMKQAKELSAALLRGECIGLKTKLPIAGILPRGLMPEPQRLNLEIGFTAEDPESLLLIPRTVCLGIGCKRDTPEEQIRSRVEEFLALHDLPRAAIESLASITLKADEPGLLEYAAHEHLPIRFFTAETLNEAPGTFSASGFVAKKTGVDCVCERAAVCGSEMGTLFGKKYAADGVTVAAAARTIELSFRKEYCE